MRGGASESEWVLRVGFSEGKIFELRPKWQDLEIHISVKIMMRLVLLRIQGFFRVSESPMSKEKGVVSNKNVK